MLRLTSASDFERVRRDGKSHAHPLVVLVACRREASLPEGAPEQTGRRPTGASLQDTRVGFVAGRSVGGAVDRNRAKRLLREAMRAYGPQLAGGWDVILIARAPLAGVKLAEAQAAVGAVLKRAGLLGKL